MHLSLRIPARSLALGAALATAAAGVAAAHTASPVVGHLYVNDNTAHVNTIAAYDRHADGTLTAVPGSPFRAGGAGTGAVIGSQGAVQIAAHGRYLLAVDAGSDQISTLRVASDGALTKLRGGVVSSGGSQPVSLAVHDSRVYVANAGTSHANYTGFELAANGRLTAAKGTTYALPGDADPGDVLVNATGTRLVGTRVGTSQIDSFTIARDGGLDPAHGSPYAAQGPGPFGSTFSPVRPDQLFVSNAHGGANAGTVSAFTDGAGASLSPIGGSPFADEQTAPCWVAIDRTGRELFAVNTAVPSVSSYAVAPSGALSLVGTASFAGSDTSGYGPEDAAVAPNGESLWVVDSKGNALSGFRIHGGHLAHSAPAQTSLPAGAAPFGLALTAVNALN